MTKLFHRLCLISLIVKSNNSDSHEMLFDMSDDCNKARTSCDFKCYRRSTYGNAWVVHRCISSCDKDFEKCELLKKISVSQKLKVITETADKICEMNKTGCTNACRIVRMYYDSPKALSCIKNCLASITTTDCKLSAFKLQNIHFSFP